MKENVTLLLEINDLRKQVHSLRQKIRLNGFEEQSVHSATRSNLEMSMNAKAEKDQASLDLQKDLNMQ